MVPSTALINFNKIVTFSNAGSFKFTTSYILPFEQLCLVK